jgi:hypothetical protein
MIKQVVQLALCYKGLMGAWWFEYLNGHELWEVDEQTTDHEPFVVGPVSARTK